MEIIPAIIAKDFEDLKNKIKLVESYIKTVQLDIMDGVFVDNITWNNPVDLENLQTNLFLEAHLMVAEPEKFLDEWLASKVKKVIIHYEAAVVSSCHSGLDPESRFNKNGLDSGWSLPSHLLRGQNDNKEETESKIFNLIKKVHSVGKEFGIALNPETPIEVLDAFISEIDLVLLMSVNSGFAGQEFQEGVIPKITALRQKYPDVKIEVDGGVNLQNAKRLKDAGADFLAVGSAIFESENPIEVIRKLQAVIA